MADFEFKRKLAQARARAAEAEAQSATAPAAPPAQPRSALGALASEVGSALTPDVTPEGRAGTALRGFGQGASLGFADELRGVSGALEEAASRGTLGRLASGAAGLLGGVPGALAAAATPQMATGESDALGRFGDIPAVEAVIARYRADRDLARREAARAEAANPKLSMVSQLAGGLAVPVPGAGGARTLASIPAMAKGGAVMGGATALGGGQVDLTRGEVGQAALETAGGAGMGAAGGAVAGGLGRLAAPLMRRGGAVSGDIVATKAAQDAEEVASEVAKLRGALGGEAQKGSRLLENLQMGATAPAATPVAGAASTVRERALQALASPEAMELREGVMQQALSDLPTQLGTVAARRAAFQQAAANAPAEAARRTSDYFSAPILANEVTPRLARLGQRAATAAGVGLLSGAAAGLGGAAAGGDPLSAGLGGAAAGFGAVMGGPGTLQMMRNFAASPRVQRAAVEGAVNALGQVPQVVGRAGQAARSIADPLGPLRQYLRPDEQEAVEAFQSAP